MEQSEFGDHSNGDNADHSVNKILRSARLILSQMASHYMSETANQLTALANQAGSESKEVLCGGIIDLIFRRATRDTVDPLKSTKLCAQLCRQLMQTSGGQGLGLFNQEHWLDELVLRLCIDSLPFGGASESPTQELLATVPGSAKYSTSANGASSGRPPAHRTTLFVADLYEENAFSALQVHKYIGHLVTSDANIKERAIGLCALLEQHGQTLDHGPWKDAMNSAFDWIEMSATRTVVGGNIAMRLEAIMRLRSRDWGSGQTRSCNSLAKGGFSMGNFQAAPSRLGASKSRFWLQVEETTNASTPRPSSALSPTTAQLNSRMAPSAPGGAIRRGAAVRISWPDGTPLSFKGTVPPSPKVYIVMGQGPTAGVDAKAKAKADAEAAATAAEGASEARDTASPVDSPKPTSNGLLPSTIPERPSPLSISTTVPSTAERPKRPVPGPLDLTSAQGNRRAAAPSALANARIIEDLNAVSYPEAIKAPNPDLNIAATPGKFRYDRDFLLQFMNVCKEKPDSLPPLDAIGLKTGEPGATPSYTGGARTGGRRVSSMGMSTPGGMQRQSSVGLGLGGNSIAKGGAFSMGSFQAPTSRLGDSASRFQASTAATRGAGGIPFPPGAAGRLTPMTRSASQGGVGAPGVREAKRTRSQRGNNRGDNTRGSGFHMPVNQTMASFNPVAPLEQSENRWVAGSTQRMPQHIEVHALVERKVRSLLNKLTMDKFDSISDQIIEYANKSENERDGATLMQVTKLVLEQAKGQAAFSEMYARLCRKMAERISPRVQDKTVRRADGQLVMGATLFRKYLLNQCQEDFERGRSAKEITAALAVGIAGDHVAAESASQTNGETGLCGPAIKAKRQGLVQFLSELYKLQMLTERIMHVCIKKLLSNIVNPQEEEVESLCKLLMTVGHSLDKARARNHVDVYFEQMQEMARGSNIKSRMRFMLQDVIELRARHWQARTANTPSITAD